ncbi:hypothetical protein C6P46_003086 [Rhodotorula mucilaginosa]|uniref:Uncharacterized protein n=1 Tax=Rhodotorula mucilaginosa TaxID=5537 RepID=A0A9P6W3I2_RHOMI|nr:hypothetical protein C6P46_003086 [Rhodotorula mucilaginosa]
MAGIDAAAALVSPVGAHTHIAEIYGLALHGHGDPEMLGIVNQWVAEMDALNRRMHRHWTVPEKASLVALLDRFKAVLHHLHGVIVHSVFSNWNATFICIRVTDPFFDSDNDPSRSSDPYAAWTDCHWYRRLALPSADEQRDRITNLNDETWSTQAAPLVWSDSLVDLRRLAGQGGAACSFSAQENFALRLVRGLTVQPADIEWMPLVAAQTAGKKQRRRCSSPGLPFITNLPSTPNAILPSGYVTNLFPTHVYTRDMKLNKNTSLSTSVTAQQLIQADGVHTCPTPISSSHEGQCTTEDLDSTEDLHKGELDQDADPSHCVPAWLDSRWYPKGALPTADVFRYGVIPWTHQGGNSRQE